jgi:hypothetical protein
MSGSSSWSSCNQHDHDHDHGAALKTKQNSLN